MAETDYTAMVARQLLAQLDAELDTPGRPQTDIYAQVAEVQATLKRGRAYWDEAVGAVVVDLSSSGRGA